MDNTTIDEGLEYCDKLTTILNDRGDSKECYLLMKVITSLLDIKGNNL